ncbi:MAG: hypothetical protein METHAR1v1_330001 [Methanothrix sp.]|jgi:hypothetical protein|nr:MAG: hypothetical protein METHAR1v1_330001 [Methanothrix sp.]
MKSANRSGSGGLLILLGSLVLISFGGVLGSAQEEQEEEIVGYGFSLKEYAEVSFAIPAEFDEMVQAESLDEGNYSEGKYVVASLLFDDSRVFMLLLYPCGLTGEELDALGLVSALNGFNRAYEQATYSEDPINISGRQAYVGQLEDQLIMVYQPSDLTVSVIFIDEKINPEALDYFVPSLQITVNEAITPLYPEYCAGIQAAREPPAQQATGVVQLEQPVQPEQAVQPGPVFDIAKMEAEKQQAVDLFEARFGKRLSF